MDLSVIIPVYNEERSIEAVIDRVKATGFAKEIILVDDGSPSNLPVVMLPSLW